MTAQLSPDPVFQWVTTAGQPAVGYQLFTYAAGTSTPQATYVDSTQTTQNTNPVILNAAGFAIVWLNPTQSYKFVLQDAAGNTIFTVDNLAGAFGLPAIGANLLPSITNTFNIGSPTFTWANGYFGTNVYIGGVPISSTPGLGYVTRTASEIAASITPTNYFYAEGNVLRYGADNTGATSAVVAIKAAVAVACYAGGASGIGNHSRVYFPHGTYKIDSDNVFGNPTTLQRGIIFEGDGIASSILNIVTGGSVTIWLYDGPVSEQEWISLTFRDLMVQGDDKSLANGFLWYQSQGLRFTNCWFNGPLSTVWSCNGNANGDSLKVVTCKATAIYSRVFVMNNNQSLNNEFFGCDFETIYGNIYEVASGGGGALRVYGGSHIMDDSVSDTSPAGGDHWLLKINGAGVANSNDTYTFFGLQTEQHATTTKLVSCGSVGAQSPHITFHDCNFTCTNGAREQVNTINCHVVFDKCVMTQDQGNTYTCQGPSAGAGDQYGEPGSIRFLGCELNTQNLTVHPSTLMNTPVDAGDSIAWGYISARDCFWSNYDSGVARTVRWAMDFDLNWQNQGRASNFVGLKVMIGKPAARQWCDATGNFNWTITLPNNALIVKILVYRAATGSNVVYTLNVGTSSNATLYGTSGASNTNLAQTISVDWSATPASWVSTGTGGVPGNTVVVSMTGTASGAGVVGSTGYFLVYYH